MIESNSDPIQQTPSGVNVRLYIVPRSSSNKVVGMHNGAIKVALTAPPVESAANKALMELLAELLGVPESLVSIVSGIRSRQKTVRIQGAEAKDVATKLLGTD